jgi:hypothetical protein
VTALSPVADVGVDEAEVNVTQSADRVAELQGVEACTQHIAERVEAVDPGQVEVGIADAAKLRAARDVGEHPRPSIGHPKTIA